MNFHKNTRGSQERSESLAEIESGLRQEFQDFAGDMLNEAEEVLEEARVGRMPGVETLVQIRRIAHNLKGTGSSFGFPLVTTIAHRLENYAADLEAIDEARARDMQIYFDYLRDVVSGALDVPEEEFADTVRDLPAKPGLEIPESGPVGGEIMLVAPTATLTRIIAGEIHAIGHRVIAVKSPFDALEQIVQTGPDAVIVSAVLDWLSGVDLICALKVMPQTRDIPVALLTSFGDGDHQLDNLPKTVPVIHKRADFSGELAAVLSSFGLK